MTLTRIIGHAWLIWLGAAAAACSDDGGGLPGGEAASGGETRLHIDLSLTGDRSRASRAANPDTPEVAGHGWENTIQTLSVFVRETTTGAWVGEVIRLENVEANRQYTVTLEEPLSTDTEVYAAANLTKAQEEALKSQIINENDCYTFSGGDWRLVTDFAPYSTREADTSSTISTIAMCCVKAAKPKGGGRDFEVQFDLKRMVAKVLVTAKEESVDVPGGESGVAYVPINKERADANFVGGWVRRDSMRYTLNGLNRKAYIMQRLDEKTDDTDANYDTDANVVDPNNDLNASATDDFYSFVLSQANEAAGYEQVLPFAEGRLADGSENHYWEGIYCPENTFAPVLSEFADGQWPMVTQAVISAKFTPRKLNVEYALFDYIAGRTGLTKEVAALKAKVDAEGTHEGTDVVGVECPDEATARLLLTESLRQAGRLLTQGGDAERLFAEDSYFYNAEKEFFTYGAAMIRLGRNNNNNLGPESPVSDFGNYVPYNGGRGYYYTYIDNRAEGKKTADNPFRFYRHGQVERNRYYILTVTSVSNPGSSFTNPNYIEVHTRTMEWLSGGSGGVSLGEGESVAQENP